MSQILAAFASKRGGHYLVLSCQHWFLWTGPKPLNVDEDFPCPSCGLPTVRFGYSERGRGNLRHFDGCTAKYPEKPKNEKPQELAYISLGRGKAILQCVDCGAFQSVREDTARGR